MLVDMWSTGMMGSENANIPLGGSVLVIGIGAVGLSAIAGAALLGAADIYAAGTRPVSVKVAKSTELQKLSITEKLQLMNKLEKLQMEQVLTL